MAALADIFDIGSLDKRVDAGEVREFPTAECGNPAIFNGIGARQTQFEASCDFFFIFCGRQQRLGFHRILGLRTVLVMEWNLAFVFFFFIATLLSERNGLWLCSVFLNDEQ